MGHLILSRKRGEPILIGKKGDVLDGPIEVYPSRIGTDYVKVGIRAQNGVRIRRSEVPEAMSDDEIAGAIEMETDL